MTPDDEPLFAEPAGAKTTGTKTALADGKAASDFPGSRSTAAHPSGPQPLATRMRPESLSEVVGQRHLIGEGMMIRRMIDSGVIGSLIFYGPPSSGKTTLAHVISRELDVSFEIINAVLDGIKELREVVARADVRHRRTSRKTVLFVDEIHRWNKAQQDALLPHLESGVVTLIGATTENPFYSLVAPLLSRCQLFELHPLDLDDVASMLDRSLADRVRGLGFLPVDLEPAARRWLAEHAAGDIRNALNALEIAALSTPRGSDGRIAITESIARESIRRRNIRYDRTGDEHYHYASALIKSMRGSDPDAALYWMSAMLSAGEDPMFIFRRMLIFASEDIGMADPYAITVIQSCRDAFESCGMPEGLYFLSHAALFLSLSMKSNSTGAVFKTMAEIRANGAGTVPGHLRDKTASDRESRYLDIANAAKDYKYPHDYPGHWVPQRYLPEEMKQASWYGGGELGREKMLWDRLRALKTPT